MTVPQGTPMSVLEAALALVEGQGADRAYDPQWHATRADLLRRLDRPGDAIASYRCALELAQGRAERRALERRLAEITG